MRELLSLLLVLICSQFFNSKLIIAQTWEKTDGPRGGVIKNIIESNGNLIAVTEGSIYYSEDDGQSWEKFGSNKFNDDRTFVSKMISQDNSTYLFANQILVTKDEGKSFSEYPYHSDIIMNSVGFIEDTLYAAYVDQYDDFYEINFYKLDEGNSKWIKIDGSTFRDQYIYIAGEEIFRWSPNSNILESSKDKGKSYHDIGSFTSPVDGVFKNKNRTFIRSRTSLFYLNSDSVWVPSFTNKYSESKTIVELNGTLYHMISWDAFGEKEISLYESKDNGESWDHVNFESQERPIAGITREISKAGNNLVALSHYGESLISFDKGRQWEALSTKGIHGLPIRGLFTTGEYVFATISNNDNPQPIYEPNDGIYRGIPNWGYGITRTDFSGKSWETVTDGPAGPEAAFFQIREFNGKLYATSQSGLYVSSDTGKHWKFITGSNLGGISDVLITDTNWIMTGYKENQNGTKSGTIWVSTDQGNSWTVKLSHRNYDFTEIAYSGSEIIIGSWDALIALSSDNGETWTTLSDDNGSFPKFDGPYPMVSSIGSHFITYDQRENVFYKSIDSGLNWTKIDSVTGFDSSKLFVVDLLTFKDSLYILTQRIHRTEDPSQYFIYKSSNGSNFELMSSGEGLPKGYLRARMAISDSHIYISFKNSAVYKLEYDPSVTEQYIIAEEIEEFSLSQNYPNPFNPTTNIQFSLPSATEVRIDVYNLLGQRVSTLVHEKRNAGSYTVTFNASNISSGVYFYVMQTINFTETKKMLLIK